MSQHPISVLFGDNWGENKIFSIENTRQHFHMMGTGKVINLQCAYFTGSLFYAMCLRKSLLHNRTGSNLLINECQTVTKVNQTFYGDAKFNMSKWINL